MKLKLTGQLKIGDWVLAGSNKIEGKFQVARVSGITFDKVEDFDLEKMEVPKQSKTDG